MDAIIKDYQLQLDSKHLPMLASKTTLNDNSDLDAWTPDQIFRAPIFKIRDATDPQNLSNIHT